MFTGTRLTAVAVAVLIGLSGCATVKKVLPSRKSAPPPIVQGSLPRDYVQSEMGRTLQSIDKSLQTLIRVERGGEAPRPATPIGSTVAGADRFGALQARPPVAVPVKSETARPAGGLDAVVAVEWDGSGEDFFYEFAKKLNYSVVYVGKSVALPRVRIEPMSAPATVILQRAADQVDSKVDVRINTDLARIELVPKG